MTYTLYLDDVRDPQDTYQNQDTGSWVVCRGYDEAVQEMTQRGWPSMVSFDHDLGDGVPTGMDFARYLVEQDMASDGMPNGFRYAVHSANPVGRDNIIGLLTGYLRFKGAQ